VQGNYYGAASQGRRKTQSENRRSGEENSSEESDGKESACKENNNEEKIDIVAQHFAEALATAQLAVINAGGRAVWRAFQQLCAHRAPAIAYTACSLPVLPEMLDLCAVRGVFTVVLGAAPGHILTEPASVAVIAPSLSLKAPYLRQLLYPSAPLPMETPCTPAPFEAPSLNQPLQAASLTAFSALAFQTYLTPVLVLDLLNSRYFETLRLGALRHNPEEAEPLLRDAEYVWFDLSAVRAADAPAVKHPGPNGLYAEEACRLSHYIGLSNHAKVLFLFGYKACLWASSRTMQLAGQLLWHVAEGAAARIYEKTGAGAAGRPGFKEIVVDMGKQGQTLHFLHSLTTRRWWMKIPVQKDVAQWISCLPADYETACRGEIPLRWLWHYQKLNY
jgi:hypothetical protein